MLDKKDIFGLCLFFINLLYILIYSILYYKELHFIMNIINFIKCYL